jgi:hypothetical protein
MCKPPCCTPANSSGIWPVLAIGVAVYLAADVLSAVLGLLIRLIEITAITLAAATVLALATWLVARRRHYQASTASAVLAPAPRAAAIPARSVRVVTATRPYPAQLPQPAPARRAVTGSHERAIRHVAEILTAYEDPDTVDDLIHRALRTPRT